MLRHLEKLIFAFLTLAAFVTHTVSCDYTVTTTPSNPVVQPDSTAPVSSPMIVPTIPPSPITTSSPFSNATITAQELKKLIEDGISLVIVDVRPVTQFEKSHLNFAISLPLETFSDRFSEIPTGFEVIIYASCAWEGDDTGTRAVQILLEKGFPDVKEMKGGFTTWQKLGYPVFYGPQASVTATPVPNPSLSAVAR